MIDERSTQNNAEEDLILDAILNELEMAPLPASFAANTMAQLSPPAFKLTRQDVALPLVISITLGALLWVWRVYRAQFAAQLPAFAFADIQNVPTPTILYLLVLCAIGYMATVISGIFLWLDGESET